MDVIWLAAITLTVTGLVSLLVRVPELRRAEVVASRRGRR
jgi:hypothetical protein